VAFGTRPTSGAINLSGTACNGIMISNKTFRDLGAGVRAITLTNCTNVVIDSVDFINVAEGVISHGGTNITVKNSRYQNILGPAHDASGNRTANLANFVQFDNVAGGLVQHNKGKCGDTEDIVSLTGSTHDVIAENNQFEGVLTDSTGCLSWKSNSGSGIAVADGSGTRNTARNNIVVNPGQVGIFINGGTSSRIDNSIIIGQQDPLSNRPSYISGSSACAAEASGNRAYWIDKNNQLLGLYTSGGCVPAQSNNNWTDTTLNIENYRVQL
jgi:hypothetical protein